jgi:hypothetical protein
LKNRCLEHRLFQTTGTQGIAMRTTILLPALGLGLLATADLAADAGLRP